MTTPPRPHLTAVDRLLLDAGLYLSCEDCFERLDGYVESRLAGGTADPGLESHLRACPACAEDVESLTALLRADARGVPGHDGDGLGAGAGAGEELEDHTS